MSLFIECKQGVMCITLNRLEKKNALSQQMYSEFTAALEVAKTNAEIRVVLVQGHPECFSAGNDLADFLDAGALTQDHPTVRFLTALSTFPKPLIGAVGGLAIGIGTTMLLHFDLVYACSPCRFQLPFTQLGLCPEAGSSLLLPQLIGLQRASALLLLSEPFSAEQALQFGLVTEVIAADELLAYAFKKALKLASLPADAVQTTRHLMRNPAAVKAAVDLELTQFERLLASAECQQVIQGFLAKK